MKNHLSPTARACQETAKRSVVTRAWRRRLMTILVGFCLCSVLIEGNLTPKEARSQTPAMLMLAAIPHRKIKGITRGAGSVYPITVPQPSAGFTLIELSIVLVIIGLIVGGVLVGRDLISAAAVRSQISQIEKYNTAVNTFRGKYNALPGDIKDPDATQFGFAPRGACPGQGDGNGVIEGFYQYSCGANRGADQSGETLMFWVDLSAAKLLDAKFSNASATTAPSLVTNLTNPSLNNYLPAAKIGLNQSIYIYSNNGQNYFGIANISGLGAGIGTMADTFTLSVAAARSIDVKLDDGLPQSGTVTASFGISIYQSWVGVTCCTNSPSVAATPGSSTTCFDNNNIAGNPQQYSMTQNNGTGTNCALSIKMQ